MSENIVESTSGELHLFCLWSAARCVEERILRDLACETEVVYKQEMSFPLPAAICYSAFYDVSYAAGERKCSNVGGGPFLLVIVRDKDPEYRPCTITGGIVRTVNAKMVMLKDRYRKWTGRKFSVHNTQDQNEFRRDVLRLTGHKAEEWYQGTFNGPCVFSFRFPHEVPAYVVCNRWGSILAFVTEEFVLEEPAIAARIFPVPLEEREKYILSKNDIHYAEVITALLRGIVATKYYPARVDDVRTEFLIRDGEILVRKAVSKRSKRLIRYGFRQLEIAPLPIFRGTSVRDLMAAAVSLEGMLTTAIAFIDELIRQFPPLENGDLPGCTFDAIPQNCIVDDNGAYQFFDLEYEMIGGVPLAYLIERLAITTLPGISRDTGRIYDAKDFAARLAEHYGFSVDWMRYRRICIAHKKFNTRCWKRILTSVFLSLVPTRSLRDRLCWWSLLPEVKS